MRFGCCSLRPYDFRCSLNDRKGASIGLLAASSSGQCKHCQDGVGRHRREMTRGMDDPSCYPSVIVWHLYSHPHLLQLWNESLARHCTFTSLHKSIKFRTRTRIHSVFGCFLLSLFYHCTVFQ